MASRRLALTLLGLIVAPVLVACARPATMPTAAAGDARASSVAVSSELLALGGPEGGRPVLLLHGRKGSRDNFVTLAPALSAAGFSVHGLEVSPATSDPREMVPPLTRALQALSARSPGGTIDVVAHSMGGLVLRAALKADPTLRVGMAVMLAVPQRGTQFARFYSDPAARAMRPGSEFLEALNADDPTPGNARYVCVYSKNDTSIFPARNAKLDGAVNIGLWGPTHGAMATAERPVRLAVEFLKSPASEFRPIDIEE